MANPQAERPQGGGRAARPQTVLQVMQREQIAPHLVRLTLGGPGFETFVDKPVTDRYIKFLFAKPELGLTPPYDMEELRGKLEMQDLPVRRTYTVRNSDAEAGTIQVDFVVHGDEGLAGPWARDAQIGDTVCFSGPGGLYYPKEEFDFHFLVGDETAIPAIAAALESMSEHMRGVAIIEVSAAEDEMELQAPAGVEIRWVHRNGAFTPENTKLESVVLPGTDHAGIATQIVVERQLEAQGVDRRDMSLSAYWAFGRAEDDFQAEKRSPVGQIFEEAPLQRS